MESDSPDPRDLASMSDALRDIVNEASPSPKSHVVLSFENVLGGYDLTRGSVPYPNAKEAGRHIAEAFPDCETKVFFAIRSLDRFLESSYIQRVFTRRETRSIEQYIAELNLNKLSWQPSARALESVVGTENLIIWEYEKFFDGEAAIWRKLLNNAEPESLLAKPAKNANASQSAKGLKYMLGINRMVTQGDARRFRRFVKKTFAPRKGRASPRLLDDSVREQLLGQYERDRADLGDLLSRSQ